MNEKEIRLVPVFDDESNLLGEVEYNNNLDVWDGNSWQSGGRGHHKGLAQLEDGTIVLIYGSDFQNTRDYATPISVTTAVEEIVRSGDHNLLDDFNLREEYESRLLKEKKADWAVKTLKVKRDTYKAVMSLKVGSMTQDDVIQSLLPNNLKRKEE